jgi:hypothetical protein
MNEIQFSKSIAMVKDVLPQSLLISGQNPLTLLHSALSKGLHDPEMTDEHCLALAQSIRVILADLAERAAEALKSDDEIQAALSVLLGLPKSQKAVPASFASPEEGQKTGLESSVSEGHPNANK